MNLGTPVSKIDLVGLFEASEGMITQYYGRIGSGKTYNATADALEAASRGEVVYLNWLIDFRGYDERENLRDIFWKTLFFRKRFFSFPKENVRFFELSDEWASSQKKPDGGYYEDFMDWFANLTDCQIFVDEGHVLFDSYQTTKFSMRKRTAILHTRHFNRTIHIISQRPTAIHVSARANVNVFYRCTKKMSWPFLIFVREEFQDMVNETVDEAEAISTKVYFAKKKVLNAYNSRYLRGGIPRSQEVFFDAFDLSFKERFQALFRALSSLLPGLSRQERGERASAPQAKAERSEAPLKPIGVESEEKAIKSGERLNTVPAGEKKPLREILVYERDDFEQEELPF